MPALLPLLNVWTGLQILCCLLVLVAYAISVFVCGGLGLKNCVGNDDDSNDGSSSSGSGGGAVETWYPTRHPVPSPTAHPIPTPTASPVEAPVPSPAGPP